MQASSILGTPAAFDSVFDGVTSQFWSIAFWAFLGYFVILPLIGEVIRALIKRAFWGTWAWISSAIWPKKRAVYAYSRESYIDELNHEHGD